MLRDKRILLTRDVHGGWSLSCSDKVRIGETQGINADPCDQRV